MICELALDPALVARWHDPREWAFFREAFAAETGRVASAYPRKWRGEVIRTFHRLFPGATAESKDRQRLEALLDQLGERMVERESSHSECSTWLEKAVAEHQERPFHGILSSGADATVSEVMTPDMLFSDRPPAAWLVKSNPAPPRIATAFAEAVAPLLTRCKEAIFVDPWFNPAEPRFWNPLAEMLKVLWGPGCCVSSPTAQLVMAEGKRTKQRDPKWLLTECQKRLPAILPPGRSLEVTVLRQRDGGENIHNRYILTKIAGISFGTGLDVADDDEVGQSDDLCRLSYEQLLKRWGQYVSARQSWFDIAAGPVVISSR
jgi:hypothetical protein